jgi:predicted deacetylase
MTTYLVRLDDLCPTMDLRNWEPLEAAVVAAGIRPIAAVVPDNADPHLAVAPADPDFWGRVRRWQSWGWTIAIHGHRHRYVTKRAGIVGINPMSEFAGLPQHEQREKLEEGLSVFRREGVDPTVWVAPAHSFDRTTLLSLRELGITTVSDGFFLGPRRDDLGMLWIPQQLWRFRPVPIGVWTVCLHPNALSAEGVRTTISGIEAHREQIGEVGQFLHRQRRLGITDGITAAAMRTALMAKRWARERPRPSLRSRRSEATPD